VVVCFGVLRRLACGHVALGRPRSSWFSSCACFRAGARASPGAHSPLVGFLPAPNPLTEKIFIQWLNAEMFYGEGEVSESLAYYFNILNTRFREKALSRSERILPRR